MHILETSSIADIMKSNGVAILAVRNNLETIGSIPQLEERRAAIDKDIATSRAAVEAYLQNNTAEGQLVNPMEDSYNLVVKGSEAFYTALIANAESLNLVGIHHNGIVVLNQ